MLIVVAGYFINPGVETQMRDNSSVDGDDQPIGFVKQVKLNIREIKEAIKIP